MPFFRDVAVGCYVRVGIGAHEGRMVYRVRQPHATTHTAHTLLQDHILHINLYQKCAKLLCVGV